METNWSPASSRSDSCRFCVGLTGGIGSGKSLIADEFERLGAQIVDTDAIAHALTAAGGNAIDAIRTEFGASVIASDGSLDRRHMRRLAFTDDSVRHRLERILHPMIRAAAETRAGAATAAQPYTVFVVPLLVESGNWRARVQRVLVIDCAPATQEQRVMRRSGLDLAAVRAIIAAQVARDRRLDAADDVLVNESSSDDALARTHRLHALYSTMARSAALL